MHSLGTEKLWYSAFYFEVKVYDVFATLIKIWIICSISFDMILWYYSYLTSVVQFGGNYRSVLLNVLCLWTCPWYQFSIEARQWYWCKLCVISHRVCHNIIHYVMLCEIFCTWCILQIFVIPYLKCQCMFIMIEILSSILLGYGSYNQILLIKVKTNRYIKHMLYFMAWHDNVRSL